MRKPWSGFSGRELVFVANRLALAGVMACAAGAFGDLGIARAQDTAAATPVPTGSAHVALSEAELMQLPAYDLEPVPQEGASPRPAGAQVGDQVLLHVAGFSAEATGALKLDGSQKDTGWMISPERVTQGLPPDRKNEFVFVAVPVKAGALTLPSLIISDGNGKPVARTNPFSLEVKSAIPPDDPKPKEAADVAPPVSLAFPWWVTVAAAVLGLALAALAIFGIYRWSRKLKSRAAPTIIEPPKAEDEVASLALMELEREGLLKKGEFKKHYFRVSEILKVYIGARYRFDAAESTTREMVRVLEEKKSIQEPIVERIEALFERMDLVKFTDHVPDADEAACLIGEARQIVQSTKRPLPTQTILPPPGGKT